MGVEVLLEQVQSLDLDARDKRKQIRPASGTPPLLKDPLLSAAIRIFPRVDRVTISNNRITASQPAQAAVVNEMKPAAIPE
ncbi:MAG: hypothetical protein NTZ46_11510 [Verrucomicrobia bacterium]|nr:hypothetical protein [Verrucomicrobiota bacterium]